MPRPPRLAWSCDERDRQACRNGLGCHCREITALLSVKARAAEVARNAAEHLRVLAEDNALLIATVEQLRIEAGERELARIVRPPRPGKDLAR